MKACWHSLLRAAVALLAATGAAAAAAQAVDTRPVRVVVPAPPGGNLDNSARALFARLARLGGETFVIDNRPGAGTQIGVEAVVRAPADGRTLLFTGTSVVLLPLTQKVPFAPLEDLAPVVQVSADRMVLVTAAEGPPAHARDLPALAASRPVGLNCAAYPGVSTLGCEQLGARLGGGRMATVPFQGISPAVASVMGGHTDVLFVNFEPVAALVRGGKLRVLAQSAGAGGAPGGAPSFDELWPGFVMESFAGVLAPAGTAPARVAQLNRDINRVLLDPEVAADMRASGQDAAGGTPQQFQAFLQRMSQRYGEVVQRHGLGPK